MKINDIPLFSEKDVLVIGAGAAGVSAAIAAAKCGQSVIIIEKNGFMGGISTAVIDTAYGFYTPGENGRKVVAGIPDLFFGELFAKNAAITRPNTFGAGTGITYDPEVLKTVYEKTAVKENIQILYHTQFVDTVLEGPSIKGVVVANKGGLQRINSKIVIDATGDADVAYRAGVPFEMAGDLSPMQTCTTTFRLCNVDVKKAMQVSHQELIQKMKEANKSGNYCLPREDGSIHLTPLKGVVLAIMTRMAGVNGTDPEQLSAAEIEGRRQSMEYIRFLKHYVSGYEQAELINFSLQVGVRETRRIYGDYRLNKEDIASARRFSDEIGLSGAPIEDHHAGTDTKWEFLPEGRVYGIPYRTLVPLEIDNMLVAGRCFSATHEAHASCRSLAQCMAMGQAAGVAAHLASFNNEHPRNINYEELRAKLKELGAILDI